MLLLVTLLLGAVPTPKAAATPKPDACVAAHQKHGDWYKTLACYEAAIKKNSKDLEARNGRAAVLAQLDRFPEALAEYNKIVETDPKNVMGLNGRAMTLLAMQRFEEGFQALELAIEAAPNDAQAVNNLARIAYSAGKVEIAEKSWRHVLTVDKTNLDARLGLGEIRLRQAKYKDAIELLGYVVQKRPDDARAHWFLGKALFAQDPGDSVQVLERAGALAFRDPAVWYDLGLARLAAGDVRLAGQAFTHALELAPDEPKLYLELGKCYIELRENDKAERFLTEALSKRPEPAIEAQVRFQRGILRDLAGRSREAEQEYLRAAQLTPTSVLYRVNLGVLYAREGRHDEAKSQFLKALEIDPADPTARFNYGAFLIDRGQTEAGKTELKKLLTLPKSHPIRKDAEALLSGQKFEPR